MTKNNETSISPHELALEHVYADRLIRNQGYVRVPSALFVPELGLKMPPLPAIDFFEEKDGLITQFRKGSEEYSSLALSNFEYIYIREGEMKPVRQFAERQIFAKDGLDRKRRMSTLRRAAMRVAEDIHNNPTRDNIKKGERIVGSFVHTLMKEPGAYLHLASLSSHDPYTLQHSVGTAINCVILARQLGISDEGELNEVGMAGLLHDIGKTRVDPGIINKDGPLDQDEWAEMEQHSSHGYDIIKDNPDLTERTKLAVLEHHEDRHGTGYPDKRPYDEVSFFAKIVCISDIFNALTTNRSYSDAREPFEAFKLMQEKLGHKYDGELFKKLVHIYGGNFEIEPDEKS